MRSAETSLVERSALLRVLRDAHLKGAHLEIGTAAGGTLRDMMSVYHEAKRPRFVVVDPMRYFPDQRAEIGRNLLAAGIDPGSIDFRVSRSWPAFRRSAASKERFSFIFIDAVHDATHVTQDLAWTRLLDVGGLVALHDHAPRFPGVVWAVGHFMKRHPSYREAARSESLIVLRKSAPAASVESSSSDRVLARAVDARLRLERSVRKRIGAPTFG